MIKIEAYQLSNNNIYKKMAKQALNSPKMKHSQKILRLNPKKP